MLTKTTLPSSAPSFDLVNRLDEHKAAEYLGRPVSTLRYWRTRGGGPRYIKCGRRVEYLRTDLEGFLAAALKTSTSDTKPSAA